ncbi:hypothetical protein chiPu_0008513 [Chiloscyllium punctatum]|uniref:Uncharacterized protein n=1 Tax=Chiloscyllium punctatum TaxID=137246 RepID=A0A401SI24_CHIPU|nr:hypothetical protein [Chiloscyllium punctatum]
MTITLVEARSLEGRGKLGHLRLGTTPNLNTNLLSTGSKAKNNVKDFKVSRTVPMFAGSIDNMDHELSSGSVLIMGQSSI